MAYHPSNRDQRRKAAKLAAKKGEHLILRKLAGPEPQRVVISCIGFDKPCAHLITLPFSAFQSLSATEPKAETLSRALRVYGWGLGLSGINTPENIGPNGQPQTVWSILCPNCSVKVMGSPRTHDAPEGLYTDEQVHLDAEGQGPLDKS